MDLKKLIKIVLVFLFIFAPFHVFAASQQTSATPASEIIENVRAYLNDDSDNFFDYGQFLAWLNAGMLDIVSRTHCLQTKEDITLVSGTLEYTLETAYTTVEAAIYTDGSIFKGLLRGDPRSAGHSLGQLGATQPAYWYEWAGKVGIYPLTGAEANGDTVTVYLVQRPINILLDDNVTTPAIYDKALTYYITAQAFQRDRKMSQATLFITMYEFELRQFRQDFVDPPKESEGRVR